VAHGGGTMRRMRIVLGLLAAVGCSNRSLSALDVGSTATDAGAQTRPGMDAGSSLSCPANGCTAAQNQAYEDCVFGRCDLPYRTCLGPGYRSGTFGGPCQRFVTCLSKCGCVDMACRTACGPLDLACQSCLVDQVARCVVGSGCMAPACSPPGAVTDAAPDAGAGCTDLMKCCASTTDASLKMACQAQYAALANQAGGDLACSMIAAQYQTAGYCTY